ncbi:hypothetical protein [Pseudomonas aeruginosa]|uniref:hypothetical protein n=1 Tax=Pseudomonas aeruginosa TaxID=287 RepID=UPI0027D20CEA|nr:hypothetical protein [Pseudomonas aeruginosa]WMB69632.1 hypothetical protein RBH62_08265 [Pseudomonas aeruginosa]
MATYYHVDNAGLLKTGMEIKLDGNNRSRFGEVYQPFFKLIGADEIGPGLPRLVETLPPPHYREFFLELFRLHDPELSHLENKSRLNCFFAAKTIDDARKYKLRSQNNTPARIFEIHTEGEVQILDMTWLDQEFPRDMNEFGYYYRQYWKGARIDQDPHLASHEKRGTLLEVLISDDFIVGEMVSEI